MHGDGVKGAKVARKPKVASIRLEIQNDTPEQHARSNVKSNNRENENQTIVYKYNIWVHLLCICTIQSSVGPPFFGFTVAFLSFSLSLHSLIPDN